MESSSSMTAMSFLCGGILVVSGTTRVIRLLVHPVLLQPANNLLVCATSRGVPDPRDVRRDAARKCPQCHGAGIPPGLRARTLARGSGAGTPAACGPQGRGHRESTGANLDGGP